MAVRSRGRGKVDAKLRPQRRVRPGLQRDDAVRHDHAFVHVVGDEHDGFLLLAPDADDLVLQLGAGQRIERAQGFVEQQDVRRCRQRARHRNPLAHAAGKFGGSLVHGGREVHHLHVFLDPRPALRLGRAFEHLIDRQRDVLAHVHPRHQRIALEYHTAVRSRPVDGFAVAQHRAFIGLQQPRHQR